MALSRRTLLAAGGTTAVAGAAGVGYGVWERKLPGRRRVGYWLGLQGDPVPYPTGPAGQVVSGTFRSPWRPGVAEPYALSAPPGMDLAGLPVVVVLHGYGDNHRVPFDQVGFQYHQAAVVAEGHPAFAVVALDGGNSYWHKRQGVDWARLVGDSLLAELDKRGLDTTRLGLCGWSMGGYGALRLAARELHGHVKAVGSMAAAVGRSWQEVSTWDAFDDEADFNANNLLDDLGRLAGVPVHLACGVQDSLIDVNRDMATAIPATQTLFVKGDHAPDFWRRCAPVQLRFIADRL